MRLRVAALWIIGIAFSTAAFAVHPVSAEVPQGIIERIANLNVELDEIRHLNRIAKLSNQDYNTRRSALQKQINALWQPYLRGPTTIADQRQGKTAIDGLVRAKLAVLVPQWQKEENDFRAASANHQKQLGAELQDDARKAAEFQRTRLTLQKQLSSGTIDRAAFDAKDREALSAIAGLRKKFETAGGVWPQNFDNRVALMTKAIADNPERPLPQSQVPVAGAGSQSPPDFDGDVKLAAAIAVKQQELHFQFEKKQVTSDTFRESDIVYDRDLHRLKMRYQAISIAREQQFENAYRRLSDPEIQAIRIKYYPAQYHPPAAPYVPPKPGILDIDFTSLFVIVGIVLFVALIVWLATLNHREKEKTVPPLTENYGSASYAPFQTEPRSRAITASGVFLGKSSEPARRNAGLEGPGAPVVTTEERHTLIVATTRTGKGTRVVVPTLLRYTGNLFAIDPKGQNAAITARTRRDGLKQTVHILNPWGIFAKLYGRYGFTAATYNPLDMLDRNDPNVVSLAEALAAAISPVTDFGENSIWQHGPADILAAVFLWLTETPGETKTLARAHEIVTLDRETFVKKFLTFMIASEAFEGTIARKVRQLIGLADNTYTGLMISLSIATKFIGDPQLRKATNKSTFSMAELRDKPTTLYLVIPPDQAGVQSTWLRLMIAAATHVFRRRDESDPEHRRCMMLIDELPALGKLHDLPQDIANMAGPGLDYVLIVQGLDQLKAIYKDHSGAILGNCAYKWFCNVTDLESAKYLSESLGDATIRMKSRSTSSGTAGGGGATETEGTTYSEKGRRLLFPDEITKLGKNVAIGLQPEGAPIYIKPIDYWNLTKAFGHLEKDHAELFWTPPLTYDDNPEFRKRSQQQPPSPKSGLSEKEAREILGVAIDAKRDDIYAAYKRLMLKVHPDTGGSNHFARQLNEAKELLLGK